MPVERGEETIAGEAASQGEQMRAHGALMQGIDVRIGLGHPALVSAADTDAKPEIGHGDKAFRNPLPPSRA